MAMPANGFVAVMPERLRLLDFQFLGEEDVVSDVWMSIEREVVAGEVGSIFQEGFESVPEDAPDDPGKTLPDEAVMDNDHLSALFLRSVKKGLADADAHDDLVDF
jgi:hypothetical protein